MIDTVSPNYVNTHLTPITILKNLHLLPVRPRLRKDRKLRPLFGDLRSPLEAAHRLETPLLKHDLILIPAVAIGRQHFLAGEDGVGAGHEAKHLLFFRERRSARRDADDSAGKNDARGGDGAERGVKGRGGVVAEWGPLDGDKGVDWEGFRMGG